MFRRIEAHDYRCLHSVEQSINPFEILIGSNASGKSTFLDVVGFLGDMISDGLESAVERRTSNFHDLVWGRQGDWFDLAVEAIIPEYCRRENLPDAITYKVVVRLDPGIEILQIGEERLETTWNLRRPPGTTERLERTSDLVAYTGLRSLGYQQRLHRSSSALNNARSDEEFPATAWLREQFRHGIRTVTLDSMDLKRPSPPVTGATKELSGAYLARSIEVLKAQDPKRFFRWLSHVRSVFPDIKDIRTVLREEDRHRYVVVDYENGVTVPSWMASEGTLRLLALTVLAYTPEFEGVYLVEEPENGIHPTALQAVYESLSSFYDGQVLIATHSPVLLSMAKPEQLLCFTSTANGTKIVRGTEHQALRDWQGEVSLGMLAASGILG